MIKLNIVHILPSIKTGGAEVFTVDLLRTLNKQNFDCSLITLFSPKPDNHLLRSLHKDNIGYYSLKKKRGFNLKTAFSLAHLLKKLKPDVIHTHLYVMKYVLLAHIGSSIPPWIHTVHNLAHRELSYIDRSLAHILYRLKKAKAVAVSHAVEKTFRSCYPTSEIMVIHNGIRCDDNKAKTKSYYRKKLSLPARGTVIISLARLMPQKNHSLLIDAFKHLQTKCRNCYLVIVGDGPLRKKLEQKVNQTHLTEKVFFTGQVNNPRSYLRAADIFALSSNREGLPISLLEAMKVGLPVVATKAGGVPEVVDHSVNGYLVNIRDMEGFASALLKLVKSKERTAFAERAREKVLNKFDIQVSARKYENIYRKLLI